MVKDVDGYLLTGPINRKFFVKARPFSSAKTINMGDYILLFLNEEIPYMFLNKHPIVPNAEIICIEFHQLKCKCLLRVCYERPTQNDLEFIASTTEIVDFYLQKFENLFIIGDLNMTTKNTHLNDLLQIFDLTALI